MGHEKRLVRIRKRERGDILKIQRRERKRHLFVTFFKIENKNHKLLYVFEETEL